ncbi:MAG: hypothetical protein AAF385_06530 [Pseudomonadota bacterium]
MTRSPEQSRKNKISAVILALVAFGFFAAFIGMAFVRDGGL